MNKKALENEETKQYKIEKKPPMRASNIVSSFFIILFVLLISGMIVYFFYPSNSSGVENQSEFSTNEEAQDINNN